MEVIMKRKGILSAAALLTAASLITGCSVPQKDTTTYKVATITDTGGVNDQAFNQLAWEGLQRFSEETGAEVSYIESKQASDYITNLDRATDGFNDLIWGTGFAMADSIATVARMNPDISFALIDNQVPDAPFNVTSVIFWAEEPCGVNSRTSSGVRGHWNRLSESRLYNRSHPSPSHTSPLMRSVRLPQKR